MAVVGPPFWKAGFWTDDFWAAGFWISEEAAAPVTPPIFIAPPVEPMPEGWRTTWLHDISRLGGMQLVGAGSLGGTKWTVTTYGPSQWNTTWLHEISKLGGMQLVGAGSLGGTKWTVNR